MLAQQLPVSFPKYQQPPAVTEDGTGRRAYIPSHSPCHLGMCYYTRKHVLDQILPDLYWQSRHKIHGQLLHVKDRRGRSNMHPVGKILSNPPGGWTKPKSPSPRGRYGSLRTALRYNATKFADFSILLSASKLSYMISLGKLPGALLFTWQ